MRVMSFVYERDWLGSELSLWGGHCLPSSQVLIKRSIPSQRRDLRFRRQKTAAMKSTIFVFFELMSVITIISAAMFACLTLAANDCPTICPANYSPVCGENSSGDKRTFPNQCTMNVFNCQNPNEGESIRVVSSAGANHHTKVTLQ
ncbi:hypothetical protein J437_LFUL019586 [Ladona fulva]|uniref:Kazal-like domain-containing protein n=1 Tax=Ladona fulva TaxID=123851 RepID=A0A8K0KR81_LADFU|nr:hypothetical protein J437_LFUL019586 [Ladona fulva]